MEIVPPPTYIYIQTTIYNDIHTYINIYIYLSIYLCVSVSKNGLYTQNMAILVRKNTIFRQTASTASQFSTFPHLRCLLFLQILNHLVNHPHHFIRA